MIDHPIAPAQPTSLLERDDELAALAALLDDAAAGQGRLTYVYGEAGIGKTALVRRFCDDRASTARTLWGSCDALFTPRPLGPLLDVARTVGGAFAAALAAAHTPYEVAVALERELTRQSPTILVLEDMHLADEATLDVLRLLGRRVTELPVLLAVTYRDDVVGRFHPLRLVLGEVAGDAPVTRVRPGRLSPEAVAALAATRGVTGQALFRTTAGNPFFVSEVLAAGDERIPETVRDAVLARAARLSAPARALLDAIAVSPPRAELWLLDALAPGDLGRLEEAMASGVVHEERDAVAFRHELARLAIEDSIPPDRAAALHRAALEALQRPADGPPDAARLAHHADAVGEAGLVVQFAPQAAAYASDRGAHRQAAAHHRRALRFAALLGLDERARLFAACAWESFLVVEFDESVAAQREALRCLEQLGDRRRQGAALRFLAQPLWQSGSLPRALEAVTASLELLRDEPGPELVDAYCEMARLQLACEDAASALDWALRAQRLAAELELAAGQVMALQTLGWVEYFSETEGGLAKLVESIELAAPAGEDWLATTACTIIVRTAAKRRDYALAEEYIEAGFELCSVSDYDVFHYYLLGWQAMVLLARGDFTEATDVALVCLADPCPFARVHALVALGLVRARRGEPGVWEALDEAAELARPRDEIQWTATVAIARAEAAWLEGRMEDVVAETDVARAMGTDGTWWSAGLAYWRRKAGVQAEPIPEIGEAGFRLELAGDVAGAHAAWEAAGCVYEAAFALLGADDEAGLRAALSEFRRLGTAPAVRLATARLREIGARGVPRGPRTTTRENPAQLTHRELEVLDLVADGLRNADIADRLVLSQRTVDHHVSAILRKLGVANRLQAATAASRLQIAGPKMGSAAP